MRFENNRSQLKIQEMAFMLVFVVIFFVLIGLFSLTIFQAGLHKKATELAEAKTLSSISNLAGSAEFSCIASIPNCVDEDKLIVLIDKKEYIRFWPFSSLKIIKFDAFNKKEENMIKCDSFNYPNCDYYVVYDKNRNESVVGSYITLCRKESYNGTIYDKCDVARFLAGTEPK